MSVVDDVHARLTAVLGPDVPVLRPEQVGDPIKGNKPGQDGGLTAYLRAYQQGYVQLEEPLGITSDGLVGVFWLTVTSCHIAVQGCGALAQQVRRALSGYPTEPGPYTEVQAAQPTQLQAGSQIWTCRPTYEALTLDGQTVS